MDEYSVSLEALKNIYLDDAASVRYLRHQRQESSRTSSEGGGGGGKVTIYAKVTGHKTGSRKRDESKGRREAALPLKIAQKIQPDTDTGPRDSI